MMIGSNVHKQASLILCVLISLLWPAEMMQAQDRPNLAEMFPVEKLEQVLLPSADWHPWPKVADRVEWNRVPESVRQPLIEKAEAALGASWKTLPATLFLDYTRTGNRKRFQDESFARRRRLRDLVVGECLEGKGRFIDEIIDGVWLTCEESYWGVPHHLSLQQLGRTPLPHPDEPTTDLFVGETAGLLAWIVYLLEPELDAVTPQICDRIRREVDRQVLTPCREREDFWWMGFKSPRHSNWMTWIDSNWLTAALILEENPKQRAETVHKILRSLSVFISDYPADGGCEEGPGYWGHAPGSLYESLELLHSATGGAVDAYDDPFIREMGRFIVKAHIGGEYFINFADAHAKTHPESHLVYGFGQRLQDTAMMQLGVALAAAEAPTALPGFGHMGRALPKLLNHNTMQNAPVKYPLLRDVWLPATQVMTARSKAGSIDGLFVAAKGGHNAEDHNHNDVGNFMIYVDGHPAIIDVGVGPYTRQNSTDRYGIWTMQSAYHNLPVIDGIMQKNGRKYSARNVAYNSTDNYAELSMDLAGAWTKEAALKSWKRSVRLERGKEVRITDRYQLSKSVSDITLSLMTPCEIRQDTPGDLTLVSDGFSKPVHLLFDSAKYSITIEDCSELNPYVTKEWGGRISRILLRDDNPAQSDTGVLRIRQK
jgi:hypothetical protein